MRTQNMEMNIKSNLSDAQDQVLRTAFSVHYAKVLRVWNDKQTLKIHLTAKFGSLGWRNFYVFVGKSYATFDGITDEMALTDDGKSMIQDFIYRALYRRSDLKVPYYGNSFAMSSLTSNKWFINRYAA